MIVAREWEFYPEKMVAVSPSGNILTVQWSEEERTWYLVCPMEPTRTTRNFEAWFADWIAGTPPTP